LLCCSGSVATPADTLPAQRTYCRCLRATLRASSGSPKPSDPWSPPAAGKAAPPRSAHPVEVRVPESVSEPLVPGLTAPRVTAIALLPDTDHPSSEYCRSCRAPNKDLVPSPESPNKVQKPAHSRPFLHISRRVPPYLLPIWSNPDLPGRAKRGLPRIDRRGCTLPRAPAAHNRNPDGPLPPFPPAQSRAHVRPAGCTLSRVPPPHTDFLDTELPRASA